MYIKKLCLLCFIILAFGLANTMSLLAQNIVTNSGFEVGKIGELPDEWRSQKESGAEGEVSLTDKEAHSGKLSLFIENTNDDGYIHPNKSVKISPGDYIFSFWAKSDSDIEFPAQIYNEADWNTLFDNNCLIKSNTWTKFEFPVSFMEGFTGSIQIGLTSKGRLWLDDVELIKKSELIKTSENIKIWDTVEKIQDAKYKMQDSGYRIQDKDNWRTLSIEKSEPSLESSKLKGDLAIEDDFTITIFCSELKNVLIFSKSGQKRAEIRPILSNIKLMKYQILRTANNEIAVEASFFDEKTDFPVTFTFGKRQIIEIKSPKSTDGISIACQIAYLIVPNFISDDLIFDPKNYASKEMINIPSERLLLGLLDTRDCELFLTTPLANRNIRLVLDKDRKLFSSIEIENDGQSIYLSFLTAPDIWHKEELKPSYLESDVQIDWKRPFPAKWVTQLYEDNVKTTYTFKATKPKEDGFWRAAIGWYTYPVWFEDEKAFIRTSKKVPPKGDAIIYFLERSGTPTSILTPVDIIKETFDPNISESILDPKGRRNRSLTRPNCAIGTATCEVTDEIKRIVSAGKEVENAENIKGGTEDMIYFLARENERAMEYQNFAKEMLNFLSSMKINKPDQAQFIERMESITKELISAYEHEKENLKDADYAKKIAEETIALTKQKSPDNLYKFIRLKEEWTGMGGAVDDLNRTLHTITRKLFQEAGYNCVDNPETVRLAEQIRQLTIKCLRNPGGYEIWSDY